MFDILSNYNNGEQNLCSVIPQKYYGIVSAQGMGICYSPAELIGFIKKDMQVDIVSFFDLASAYCWCCARYLETRQMKEKPQNIPMPGLDSFNQDRFCTFYDALLPEGYFNYEIPRYFAFCSIESIAILTTPELVANAFMETNSLATVNEFSSKDKAEQHIIRYAKNIIGALFPYMSNSYFLPIDFMMETNTQYPLNLNLTPEGMRIWGVNFIRAVPFVDRTPKKVIELLPPDSDAFLPKK